MLSPREFERYLHKHIPITKAIGLTCEHYTPGICKLNGAFAPNINHKFSAFGGSLNSALILAGWSLAHAIMEEGNWHGEIVIQHSNTEFIKPVMNDFVAICETPGAEEAKKFVSAMTKFKKGRIALESRIECENEICAQFSGQFVAIIPPKAT